MYSEFSNAGKEFVLKDIDDELIYYTYLKYFPKVNKAFLSPFKKENTPSFRFYINKDSKLRFKCFSTGNGGDAVELVKVMFNLGSNAEAIAKIKQDLGYNGETDISKTYTREFLDSIERVDKTETTPSVIEVLSRKFDLEDLVYWAQFGLNEADLNHWDVKACKEVWVNNKIYYKYRKVDPCYRYRISDRYKIYRPTRIGNGKWMTNATAKNVQGFRFLPDKGELLIITKSYKDIMVLNKHLGLNAISFGSESATITDEMLTYLNGRFDNVILFYDNDEAGIKAASKINMELDIPFIYIPQEHGSKDPAELYKDKGKQVFIEIIKGLLTI